MDLLTVFSLIALVCLLAHEIVSRLEKAEERREHEIRRGYDSIKEERQRLARVREVARQKAIARELQAEKTKTEISEFKASSLEEQLRQICEEHRGDHLRLLQDLSLRLTWPTIETSGLRKLELSWVEKALIESFHFAFTEFRYVGDVKTPGVAKEAFSYAVGVSNTEFGQRSKFLCHQKFWSKVARSYERISWETDFEVDPWNRTVRIVSETTSRWR